MMFSLKLTDLRILNGAVNILADFITEATFSIQKEGIKLIAMDPANISMVVLTILPSAFVEYTVDEPEELTARLPDDWLPRPLPSVGPSYPRTV